MSITKKTIIMVVFTTVILFSLLYALSNYIYLQGFNDLERAAVRQNTLQVTEALSVKLNTLDAFCRDWSSWDDTYNFAKEFNQEYVDRNLMDQTFLVGDLSIFLVLDIQGETVYGKAFDSASQQEIGLPEGLPGSLSVDALVKKDGMQSVISGVTLVSGQPMLVSARPVLTSLDEGPSTGSLIMGRFLDASVIATISETTHLEVEFLSIPGSGLVNELDDIMIALNDSGDVYIGAQNKNFISGYTLIQDLAGNPVFVLKVSIPRDIYSQAIKTIAYFHSSLLFIGIVFCLVFVFLIRNLLLNRLTALNKAVNVIGSKGDITERVAVKGKDELSRLSENINNMLESLEKSEVRRQSQKEIIGHIMANTPSGVLAFKDDGSITLFNDAFLAFFGLRNVSLVEKKVEDVPELSDITLEIKKFIESRLASSKQELQYLRDGVNRIYIAGFARLKEEELYILYLTDITDEHAKQESLYLTDRLASIGEMVSGVAHELNNPLTSIIGLSEIVMRDEVPESIKEDIELIKSESHRAAGIVRNLLSFARKNTTIKQPANLNKLLLDVLRLRSYEHGVNNIAIIQELDPLLPEIMVDHSQIQQVFINIILNAEYAMVNAHGKGTLKVRTEVAHSMLKVSFIDDGPGIEPQSIRHVFDPFFTTKEPGKGTGLGLSISYGIITAHNGQISAVSEIGKGTAFIIELPLHTAANA